MSKQISLAKLAREILRRRKAGKLKEADGRSAGADEAEKAGLIHKQWGQYADPKDPDTIVARVVNGKLQYVNSNRSSSQQRGDTLNTEPRTHIKKSDSMTNEIPHNHIPVPTFTDQERDRYEWAIEATNSMFRNDEDVERPDLLGQNIGTDKSFLNDPDVLEDLEYRLTDQLPSMIGDQSPSDDPRWDSADPVIRAKFRKLSPEQYVYYEQRIAERTWKKISDAIKKHNTKDRP